MTETIETLERHNAPCLLRQCAMLRRERERRRAWWQRTFYNVLFGGSFVGMFAVFLTAIQ